MGNLNRSPRGESWGSALQLSVSPFKESSLMSTSITHKPALVGSGSPPRSFEHSFLSHYTSSKSPTSSHTSTASDRTDEYDDIGHLIESCLLDSTLSLEDSDSFSSGVISDGAGVSLEDAIEEFENFAHRLRHWHGFTR